jgi:type I restriction enzyme R subunit
MPSQTNEQALEASIEKKLTGSCLEELQNEGNLQERKELYRGGNGYYIGYASDFNTKYAIDEVRFWHFLETNTTGRIS